MDTNTIHTGDVRDRLADLPDDSVHMAMTSPPYFGLRDYGHDDQIGLEDDLAEYVEELVAVGRDLRRVLRDDGSWWLNLGDTYDDKQKLNVPYEVARELKRDGWIERNDATWLKPNPMPQSVKDRLNTTTEQVFHFVPQKRYWYDLDAIREPHAESTQDRMGEGFGNAGDNKYKTDDTAGNHNNGGIHDADKGFDELLNPAGKNPGDVFEVSTKPFPDAHFAVYPPELCEKPIKASCPPKVCADCGTGYTRHRETEDRPDRRDRNVSRDESYGKQTAEWNNNRGSWVGMPKDVVDEWWEQPCDCDTDATEPGIVLDPFAGAGTTLLKAKELGRRFVGIELNPEYADMARARIGLSPEDPANVRDDTEQSGMEQFT
jgi:DNA modification methylase